VARVTFRHFLSWKPLFYDGLLPSLRLLGPARGDAILGGIGRLLATAWPPRRWELAGALQRVSRAIEAGWEVRAVRPTLEGNLLRFLARESQPQLR